MAAKGNSISKTFVWILLALLILGLAGFGAVNLSGRTNSIGTVGETPIKLQDYVRVLRQEMNQYAAQTGEPVNGQQARLIGLDQRALARVVATASLENEAKRVGVSVGDSRVRDEILRMNTFQAIDGAFDRDTYKRALENSGLNESEFETQLRNDLASSVLERAVRDGVAVPNAYLDLYIGFIGETRSATYAKITSDRIAQDVPEPTQQALETFYQDNIARYTLPEAKNISVVWLKPEDVADDIEIDEAKLRQIYQERSGTYKSPERRLVERLVFADQAQATAARARLDNGSAAFEDLVFERDLALEDADMGDVTLEELGDAGATVFDAAESAVVGPLPTDLGPALFRVNGIIAADEQSFDDVRDQLRDELLSDLATRRIDAQRPELEDELAAGVSLEELAANFTIALSALNWTEELSDGLSGYEAFRDAARSVNTNDFPSFFALDDGGIVAIRLNHIIEAAAEPYEVVKVRVQSDWDHSEHMRLLSDLSETMASELAKGASFESLGTTPETLGDIQRTAFIMDPTPEIVARIFETAASGAGHIVLDDAAVIYRVDSINEVDFMALSPELDDIKSRLKVQLEADLSRDLFEAYLAHLQQQGTLRLEQAAIDSVLSQL